MLVPPARLERTTRGLGNREKCVFEVALIP